MTASVPAPRIPPPPRRGWRRALLAFAALLALCGIALGWLLGTASGLSGAIALARLVAPGFDAVPRGGTLWRGPTLARLTWHQAKLRIDATDVALRWHADALWHRQLQVDALDIATLTIRAAPDPTPPRVPASLQLPVDVDVARLSIGTLDYGTDTGTVVTLHAVQGQVHGDARQYRVEARAATPAGDLSVHGQVDTQAPFATTADAQLHGADPRRDYTARLHAGGTLAQTLSLALQAQGHGLSGHADAEVHAFAPQPLGTLRLALDAFELRALAPTAPQARLAMRAELTPQGDATRLSGPVQIDNLAPGRIDAERIPVSRLSGQLQVHGTTFTLADLHAQLGDGKRNAGELRGSAAWDGTMAQLEVQASNVDAQALHRSLRATSLSGPLKLRGNATTQSLQADLSDRRFSLRADVTHDGDALDIRALRVAAGTAQLQLHGRAQLGPDRRFDVAGRFDRFDPAAFADVPHARLNGTLAAKGQLAPQLQAELELALSDSRWLDQPLSGRGSLRASARRIDRADIHLDVAGNQLTLAGALGQPGDVLQVSLHAPQLATLGKGVGVTLGGTLQLDAALTGRFDQPAGTVTLQAAALHLPGGLAIAHLSGDGALAAGGDGIFKVGLDADGLDRDGAPLARTVALRIDGSRARHEIRLQAQRTDTESLLAVLRGGIEDEAAKPLAWNGTLERFEIGGATPYAAALRAPAPLHLSAGEVVLGAAELAGAHARVQLQETRWTPDAIALRGTLSGLAVILPGMRDDARHPVLRLGADWNLRLAQQAQGSVRVFRESGDLWIPGEIPVSLGLDRLALDVSLHALRMDATLAASGARLGEVDGRYTAALAHDGALWHLQRDAPHAGRISLQMPSLGWLGPLLGANASTGGRLGGEFKVDGTPASPRGSGTIAGDMLAVSVPGSGLHLANGNLRMSLDDTLLRLDELRFDSPLKVKPREPRIDLKPFADTPGQLSATGEVQLADRRANLHLVATRLLALQRPDRWVAVSGEGNLQGTPAQLDIKGTLGVDAALLEYAELGAPQLSDDVVVKGRAPTSPALRTGVDVQVKLGNRFFFRGRGLDTRLSGSLALRGDQHGRLSVIGTIATRGGSFDAYGRKLDIERGLVNFQGPLDNAGLNVRAIRRNLPVEAGVEVTGTVQRPVVRLVSDPDVPDAEKLSWIVLGRGGDTVSGADASQLIGAASALLGGDGEGLTARIARSFGLDEIAITQGQVGATGERPLASSVVGGSAYASGSNLTTQIVTVGKQLSSRAYLSYEQSLDGAANIVKLTYSLSRRLSLIGRAGADNAIDLRYVFSFN